VPGRLIGIARKDRPHGRMELLDHAVIGPCHRFIGSNGTLTGYGGGLDRKRWLLAHEGVVGRTLF